MNLHFFWFCRTWTKRYLITSQTRVKRVSRIHHRTNKSDKTKKRLFGLVARNCLSLFLPLSFSPLSYFLSFSIQKFTLSLAKNSHNWRWAYTFPCQKFALFVSPFTLPVSPFAERPPWWRWNSQWVHTFHCQNFFALRLCSPSFKWHEPRDEWSKTQDKWSNPAQSYTVLPNEKMNQINTKNYWK